MPCTGSFYGPSALMAELHAKLARGPLAGAAAAPIVEAKQIGLPFPEFNAVVIDSEVAYAVGAEDAGLPLRSSQAILADNVLLYGSDAEVGNTTTAHREAVLDILSDLVLDAVTVRERTMYEQLLARALFRACLL